MDDERIYRLQRTSSGYGRDQMREGKSRAAEEFGDDRKPATLEPPDWDHWRQRKLARPHQATLLGMNLEPTPGVRALLRKTDPDRYRVYKKRYDITMTLMGWEFGVVEDHAREGHGAGGKYIELADYYRHATGLGWTGLEAMRSGLRMDTSPPEIKRETKTHNSLLRLLHQVISVAQPSILTAANPTRKAKDLFDWLSANGVKSAVEEPTLVKYIRLMEDAVGSLEERRSNSRNE